MRRWVENEDWVEYYTPRDLKSDGRGRWETLARFCGPMARSDYHFYARVAEGSEEVVAAVEVDGAEFHADRRAVDVPGTAPGVAWVHLGHTALDRCYRKITLTAPQGLEGLERLCIAQVPHRLESGIVEHRIMRELAGNPEPLSGVPLGGVGAGKIEFCSDGLFRNITVNGNIDAPIWTSDASFFAVRAEAGGKAQTRVISTEELHGLAPFGELEFSGAYPTGRLRADDPQFPVTVEVLSSGTVIPRNVKDSSLPLALFTVRLTARERAVRASVAFCFENLLGCGGGLAPGLTERHTLAEGYYEVWEEREGNRELAWEHDGLAGVLFDGSAKQEKRSEGQYVLATDGRGCSRLMGWRLDETDEPWQSFAATGEFAQLREQTSDRERTAGAAAVEVDLQPGETREVRFVLAWHVPFFQQSPVMEYGHYYSNHFASAAEVAAYGLVEFDRLRDEAAAVPDLLLSSSLPEWLARSLANDAFVFSSATWLTRDGRFAVNEGPTQMFGCMGTLDQKLYANHYYSLFFPELDRTELLGFARAQSANGGVQHDLGSGHLEMKGRDCAWPDLNCALVILSLKHYQLTGDEDYIDEVYPRLVRTMLDHLGSIDYDGDGLADGPEVGNTFDAEHFEGVSCYTATVTMAALRSLEDLAIRRGDSATAAECRKRFLSARESATRLLWNERYFIGYYNTATGKTNPNCHLSQLAGEYFAWLCGLGELYPPELAHRAARSTLRLNYPSDLAFPTNDATPEGRPASRQMWGWLPHARLSLGALPICAGMPAEGLDALERMDRVLNETNRGNRWDLRLFYEPDTGREHWGRFYMSAPATWYAYQALLGYTWDKPAGALAVVPNVPDSLLPLSAPVFLPDFWAWLDVPADRSEMRLRVIARFGSGLRIRRLVAPALAGNAVVTVDGEAVPMRSSMVDGRVVLECEIDLDSVSEIRVSSG